MNPITSGNWLYGHQRTSEDSGPVRTSPPRSRRDRPERSGTLPDRNQGHQTQPADDVRPRAEERSLRFPAPGLPDAEWRQTAFLVWTSRPPITRPPMMHHLSFSGGIARLMRSTSVSRSPRLTITKSTQGIGTNPVICWYSGSGILATSGMTLLISSFQQYETWPCKSVVFWCRSYNGEAVAGPAGRRLPIAPGAEHLAEARQPRTPRASYCGELVIYWPPIRVLDTRHESTPPEPASPI